MPTERAESLASRRPPPAPPSPNRDEKYGSQATVSFVFLADQNPAKLWQNLAKFVRIYQKCCILRKSQYFLDNLAKFRQILIGIGAKFVEISWNILIFYRKLAKKSEKA